MPITSEPRGSLWRKWDLHIHSPVGKLANAYDKPGSDESLDKFIDFLEASDVFAFGITDYFGAAAYTRTVERYKAKHPNSKKALFPNIELRLVESISAKGTQPHLHIIFDNDPELCGSDGLTRFCTHLKTQAEGDSNVRLRCSDLDTATKLESATVSLDDVLKALSETFGEAKPYLLFFPANNDGIRSTDTKAPRKVQLADRIDRTCQGFFGNASNRDYFLRTDRYKSGDSGAKPVVAGSDAHSFADLERLSGDVAGFPSTWIKADLTFRGLQQIVFEPEYRVFIGAEPDVLSRQREDATKFIETLRIDQIEGYDESNGRWFKKVSIPLNPELTAIIGNKGSCKSAVVDVLGLLGESRQEAYFSFLTDDTKNKKFRQPGYAENFFGEITWLSGTKNPKKLSDHSDRTVPETIRYLPQNYFEQLTNEIEIEKFRKEIEEVVFSHVEESNRLGKTTFAELEEYRTLQSKQETSVLKARLRELNIEIVRLEEQAGPQFRKQLVGQRKVKADELAALDRSKPKEIPKPGNQTNEQKEQSRTLDLRTALLGQLNGRGQRAVELLGRHKAELQAVVAVQERLATFKHDTERSIREIASALKSIGLDATQIIGFSVSVDLVTAKINEVSASIAKLDKDNKLDLTLETDFDKIDTLPDMRAAYAFVAKSIEQLKEQLSTPQRQYQAYVEKLASWQKRRDEITGTETDPRPDTLRGIEAQLRYLDETLPSLLADRRAERVKLVKEIFKSKRKVLAFYADLKSSVEDRLNAVRTEGFSVEIDASFVLDQDFRRKFLGLINRQKRGPYRNNEDAQKILAARIASARWNDVESVLSFVNGLIDEMRSLNGEPLSIGDQVHSVKDLYDFLYSMEYFDARYELRLSGKNLNELSPGEKGLLLLVFYLQLDRKNTPLVIDQPEDNLDNDSIFQVLAKCIREAKKTRQVVLVTHNPNLAVGADAEEVVYVKLDKTKSYQFSWESGAIENPTINARIVTILEGSQPAFVKRRLKYGI